LPADAKKQAYYSISDNEGKDGAIMILIIFNVTYQSLTL